MTGVYINIREADREAGAPFFFPDDFDRSARAFLQLDTLGGEISFGSEASEPLLGWDCRSGQFMRWQVSAKLRGDKLESLAYTPKLLRLLQRVCDGAFNLSDDQAHPRVELSSDAKKATDDVQAFLSGINWLDRGWEADIVPVVDFIEAPPTWLTADTPDAELEARADETQEEADAQGLVLHGSILETLTDIRDCMRRERKIA